MNVEIIFRAQRHKGPDRIIGEGQPQLGGQVLLGQAEEVDCLPNGDQCDFGFYRPEIIPHVAGAGHLDQEVLDIS